MDIGQTIRRARQGRSWSLDQLADAVGLSQSAISRIELEQQGVSFAQIERIAAALGLTVNGLIGS